MAYIIDLPTFKDERGGLTVMERLLGGHRHKKTVQALICVGGSCEVYVNDGQKKEIFLLDNPSKCLLLEPEDWHTMDQFTKGSTLLVFASEFYDKDDYIGEEY